jgi:hypothetical protein
MPPKKSWVTDDIRKKSVSNYTTSKNRVVDHKLELQAVTKEMNKTGVGNNVKNEIKKYVNHYENLESRGIIANNKKGMDTTNFLKKNQVSTKSEEKSLNKNKEGLNNIKELCKIDKPKYKKTEIIFKNVEKTLKKLN